MKYFVTLDVGTTAVKAGVFTQALDAVALVIREYELLTPAPDQVELEPDTYWTNACAAVRAALMQAGISPYDVLTVTCATQGETLIPVDAKGTPLHHAVVWLDGRAKAEATWISGRVDKLDLYRTTGLPEVNGFTPLAKLLWFKNNLPDVYAGAHQFLLLEDYLVHRLSGQFVSNPAVLCTTGYLDIQTDGVWREMLHLCGLDAAKIPAIRPSGTPVGPLTAFAAAALGLTTGTLVTTGAMDQVASAIGSGNIGGDIVTETTGTCQAIAATVDKGVFPVWSPVTYYSHAISGKLLKIVINQTAGIAYKWFRNEFCPDLQAQDGDAFDRMNELAAREPALCRGVALFPHMTGMQFPVVDEGARGVFFGVGLDATRGCFIRAIMEGVGYMLRESLAQMGLSPARIISLGGGAKSALWCGIKASICHTVFETLQHQETTSLGAAMLGGLAIGVFPNLEAAAGKLAVCDAYTPSAADEAAYDAGYERYLRMYRQFAPLFQHGKEA